MGLIAMEVCRYVDRAFSKLVQNLPRGCRNTAFHGPKLPVAAVLAIRLQKHLQKLQQLA